MGGAWRTISVALTANSAGYTRAMSTASVATKKFEAEQKRALDNSKTLWQRFGKVAVGGLALLTAALVGSIVEAISWESAWAGVAKTVDGTETQLRSLESGLISMSLRLPATRNEIAAVAEAAGALGIATPYIEGFTEVMIGLGEATNLSADEAATSLAQFANIMGTSQDEFESLADTLVHLGNNGASTEREIVEMSLRLAGAGRIAGLTENEVMALANAMASMGLRSELGGGAFSRILLKMHSAVLEGGDRLAAFADVAGMSAEEFATAWSDKPAEAVQSFVAGLTQIQNEGGNVVKTLRDLGIKGTQEMTVILGMLNGIEGLKQSFVDAEEASGALARETEQRYKTVASQLEVLRNKVTYVGLAVGTELLPAVVSGIRLFEDLGATGIEVAREIGGRLAGAWDNITSAVADLRDVLGVVWDTAEPVVSLFAKMAAGAILGGIIGLAEALAQVAGFLAQNEGLVRALTAALVTLHAVKAVRALVDGFVLLAQKAYDAVTATRAMATNMTASLSGITTAGVVGAGALAGLAGAVYLISEQSDRAKRKAAELAGAIDSLRSAAEASGRSIEDEFINSNLEEFWVDNVDLANRFGVSMSELRKGLTGTGDDFLALVNMVNSQAGEMGMKDTIALNRALVEQRKILVGATEDARNAAFAQEELGTSAVSTTETTKALNTSVSNTAAAYAEMAKQVDEAYDALEDYYGLVTSNIETEINARDAIDGVNEEIKSNIEEHGKLGRAFDLTTQAGRDNTKAMVAAKDAILEHAINTAKQNDSVDDGIMMMSLYAATLRQSALDAGATESEVDAMIATMELTPEDIRTAFTTHFDGVLAAQRAFNDLGNLLNTTSWTAHLDVDDKRVVAAMNVVEELLDGYIASNPEAQAALDITDPVARDKALRDMLDAFIESDNTAKAHLDSLPAEQQKAFLEAELKRFSDKRWTSKVDVVAAGVEAVELALQWIARPRTAAINVTTSVLRSAADAIGAAWIGQRWGGITEYAQGGVHHQIRGAHVARGDLIRYAEPVTGREAYIPERGNSVRSLATLREAASWLNMAIVPKAGHAMAAGGILGAGTAPIPHSSYATTSSSSTTTIEAHFDMRGSGTPRSGDAVWQAIEGNPDRLVRTLVRHDRSLR